MGLSRDVIKLKQDLMNANPLSVVEQHRHPDFASDEKDPQQRSQMSASPSKANLKDPEVAKIE